MNRIDYALFCFTGKIRTNNEDNYFCEGETPYLPEKNEGLPGIMTGTFDTSKRHLAAVFDGIGGAARGELAAHLSAKTLSQLQKEIENSDKEEQSCLRCCIGRMNREVVRAEREEIFNDSGTTMNLALFHQAGVLLANLGDSRIFVFKNGELHLVSEDHVIPSTHPLMRFYSKPPITQYLGIPEENMMLRPHFHREEYQDGMLVLLTTDGVTDLIPESDIQAVIAMEREPGKILEHLKEKVLQAGAIDNTTAALFRVSCLNEGVAAVER
jgi:protein phosphatase